MSPKIRGAVVVFSLLVAVSSFAQRQRPVRHAGAPLPVSGIVTDVDTGKPVIQAEVASGRTATLTNAEGRFELALPLGQPATLNVRRSGYETQAVSVTPTAGSTIQIRLKSKPVVTLRTTTGATYQLDIETAQFAYLIPVSGYVRSDAGNFCRSDGSPFLPHKSTIVRITGPAVATSGIACCTTGSILKIEVELKSGEKGPAFLSDTCVGYQVDFIGRDHTTAEWRYANFSEVAEIVFP